MLFCFRATQRFNFIDALPISENVWKVGAEQEMFRADFAPKKIESLDVVNERVKVEVSKIRARHGSAPRRVGAVCAAGRLFSGEKLSVKAVHVIGEKAAAMTGAEFQFRESVENAAINKDPE
jgi:hypothetical protein